MNKTISLLLTLIFLALGVILGVLNPHLVRFDVFFTIVKWPLSLLLALSFVAGALLTLFALLSKMLLLNWKLKKQVKENMRQADHLVQLKKEITQLKAQQKSQVKNTELTPIS